MCVHWPARESERFELKEKTYPWGKKWGITATDNILSRGQNTARAYSTWSQAALFSVMFTTTWTAAYGRFVLKQHMGQKK